MPAHVFQQADTQIARWSAVTDSTIAGQALNKRNWHILKGDAGEGRTYADLVGRYGRERILHKQDLSDRYQGRLVPDFAVVSEQDRSKLAEIIDAKAWSLARRHRTEGHCLGPASGRLINMRGLRKVVTRYASAPDLTANAKVVLYFPEDVLRHAPRVVSVIEGWSGTDAACGRRVEVRSMKVWNSELWEDVRSRSGR